MTPLRSAEIKTRRNFRRIWAGLPAAVWTVELALGDLSPALAQRRRAEPEANPQFQSEVQGSPSAPAGRPVASPESSREEEKTTEISSPPSVQSIQVGAASDVPETPPAPRSPMETRVTVRVKEAPLATFLDTISAQAKVNFIIGGGLENKRVTAFLQNMTVREALQTLLEIKGLTYQRIGNSNTYIVSPRSPHAPSRITRIYSLNYVSLIPITQTVAPGGASTTGGISFLSAGGASGGGAAGGGAFGGQAGGAGAAQDRDSGISFLGVVKSVLSTDGKIATDPRSNSLIVTDIAEIFPQVEQIIAELDKKAPQIMIEAQIVEIDSDKTQNLGIEWGGANGELVRFQGGSRETTFPLGLPVNLKDTHFFQGHLDDPSVAIGGNSSQSGTGTNVAGSLGSSAGSGGGNTLKIVPSVVTMQNLSVILRALITRSEARFLGKPKVLTLNNKSATIQITKNQAIGVNLSNASSGGGGGTINTATAERQQTGLMLRVTPQINKEGFITMLVEPSFSDVQASAVSNPGGSAFFDPVTRTASSLMRVKNGQTMVVGGLLSSSETKLVKKVPLLGYIPLIGWLFTSVSTQRNNTDLVIFLTPTIVND